MVVGLGLGKEKDKRRTKTKSWFTLKRRVSFFLLPFFLFTFYGALVTGALTQSWFGYWCLEGVTGLIAKMGTGLNLKMGTGLKLNFGTGLVLILETSLAKFARQNAGFVIKTFICECAVRIMQVFRGIVIWKGGNVMRSGWIDRKTWLLSVAAALAVLCVPAMSRPVLAAAGAAKEKPAAVKAGEKKEEGKGRLLARIGDRKIYEAEIDAIFNRMPDEERAQWVNAGELGKALFIRQYVRNELIQMKAKALGIDQRKDIKWEVYQTERNLIGSTYMEEEAERRVKLEDGEVEKYYQEHLRGFNRPNQASVDMIKCAAVEKADKIAERLAKGEDFVELALKESEDKVVRHLADDWGHVGGVGTFPEVIQGVFSLKKGEYTRKPLKRFDGYYLFRVDELIPAQNKPFSEIKKEVETAARYVKVKKEKEKMFNDFLNEKDVEILLAVPAEGPPPTKIEEPEKE